MPGVSPLYSQDARFPNELDLAKENGAKVIWLHRPALVPKDFHASETSIGGSDCDMTLKSLEGEELDTTIELLLEDKVPTELIM